MLGRTGGIPHTAAHRFDCRSRDYPDRIPEGVWLLWWGEILYENGPATLVNKRMLIDNSAISFKCRLDTQNFVPPTDELLTFSAYRWPVGTDAMLLDLGSGAVTALTNSS